MISLRIDADKCNGCVKCMHACPTRALRVRDGTAVILDDYCIDCGECVTACEKNAIVPLIDTFEDFFQKFKFKIALPSPVLYSQFGGTVQPNDILAAIRSLGFGCVVDEAYICEMVSSVIKHYADKNKSGFPYISSMCPVVTRLIQMRFHDLIHAIIPLQSPREITAQELKRKYSKKLGLPEEDIGVLYITPCSAKINAIKDPPARKKSTIDAAMAIKDMYMRIANKLFTIRDSITEDDEMYMRASGLGISWGMVGGEIANFDHSECIAVSGIRDVIKILEDIDRGRFSNLRYLELRACREGCLGGNLNVEDRYVARMNLIRLVDMFGSTPKFDREKLMRTHQSYFSFEKEPSPIRETEAPLNRRRDTAIEMLNRVIEIHGSLKQIDCGACGSPDCATFAEDVVREYSTLDQCVFIGRDKK
ncbi:MAG: [Fe-Fe] hydrogenase large subunit C-terminal domain-containing protein [Pseudomonadota bacterium]